jgi:hypothetical protein
VHYVVWPRGWTMLWTRIVPGPLTSSRFGLTFIRATGSRNSSGMAMKFGSGNSPRHSKRRCTGCRNTIDETQAGVLALLVVQAAPYSWRQNRAGAITHSRPCQ